MHAVRNGVRLSLSLVRLWPMGATHACPMRVVIGARCSRMRTSRSRLRAARKSNSWVHNDGQGERDVEMLEGRREEDEGAIGGEGAPL